MYFSIICNKLRKYASIFLFLGYLFSQPIAQASNSQNYQPGSRIELSQYEFGLYLLDKKFFEQFDDEALQDSGTATLRSAEKIEHARNTFEKTYRMAIIDWASKNIKDVFIPLGVMNTFTTLPLALQLKTEIFQILWQFNTLHLGAAIEDKIYNNPVLFPLTAAVLYISSIAIPVVTSLYGPYLLPYPVGYKMELPIKSLMCSYAMKRPLLSHENKVYIDELFYQYFRNPSESNIDQLKRLLDIALRMPLIRKEVAYNHDRVLDLFRFFPKNIVTRMSQFIFAQVRNMHLLAFDEVVEDTRYPVYLVGKPGTGKTFTTKLVGKALELPIASVNLDGATIDDMIGLGFNTTNAKPGRLLEALTANTKSIDDFGFKNQILIIDEFDRLFKAEDYQSRAALSYLMKLLDPDSRKFFSPFLNSWVELPDTIILAGNFNILDFKEEEFEAIQSRIEVIPFYGFELDKKIQLVFDFLVPEAESKFMNIKNFGYRYEGLTKKEKDAIHDFILTDKDGGIRSVGKFISNMVEQSHQRQFLINQGYQTFED